MMGLPGREKEFDDIFSRLETIHQCDGRTDGQTDTGRPLVQRLRTGVKLLRQKCLIPKFKKGTRIPK